MNDTSKLYNTLQSNVHTLLPTLDMDWETVVAALLYIFVLIIVLDIVARVVDILVMNILIVQVALERKEVSKPMQAQDVSGGTQMVGLKRDYNITNWFLKEEEEEEEKEERKERKKKKKERKKIKKRKEKEKEEEKTYDVRSISCYNIMRL